MGSRRIWAAVASIVVPGAGHFAIGRPWRGAAWWGVAAISVLLLPVVVWMPIVFSMILVRAVAAVEVCVLQDVRPVPWPRVIAMWVLCALVTFGFARTVRAFYIEGFKIPAGSMIPTLQIGDHIFINKLADYGPGDVVVFTNPCQPDTDFVKRIVAVGGDTVETRCGKLYVNDRPVPREPAGGECEYSDYDGMRWIRERCVGFRETLGDTEYGIVFPHYFDGPAVHERDFPTGRLPSCRNSPGLGRIEDSQTDDAGVCAPRRHYVVPDGYVFVLGDNRFNSSDSRIWGPVPVGNVKGKAFLIWWSSPPDGDADWSRIDKPL